MSVEITTAMVEQYQSNVRLLSQQSGSVLRGFVRNEPVKGEHAFFEQIGSTAAQKKTARHMDTPQTNTPHSRRKVSVDDYVWADFIDNEDQIRTLIDPTNPYAVNAVNAFGRSIDEAIIAAASGTSYTGKAGGTAVALPSAQKVAVGTTGLSVAKLISAKNILWKGNVDANIPLHIAVSSQQIADLLAVTQITSADYNSVKALVAGDVDTFMGFQFHRTQLLTLTTATDVRTCFAWAQDGLCLGVGADIHTKISDRADKNHLTQVWCGMSVGATRMEEAKVVEIMCDESP